MVRDSRGMTLVELAIVLAVIATLVTMAVASYRGLVRTTRAAQAVADIYAVRTAAYLYYGDTGRWPPETLAGIVPRELRSRLPKGFQFRNAYYTLDWENWMRRDQELRYPRLGIAAGISFDSRDRALRETVLNMLQKTRFRQTFGTKYTFELAGTPATAGSGGWSIPPDGF